MNNFELIDDLIAITEVMSVSDEVTLDALRRRTALLIKNLFGPDSQYLNDLERIPFYPLISSGEVDSTEVSEWWVSGQTKLISLLRSMKEDLGFVGQLRNPSHKVSQKLDDRRDEAIEIFGNLVNYFATLTYPDPDPSKTAAQLARTHEAIKKRFGSDSEYFRQVQGIRFHHGRARKSNKPIYFNTSKNKLTGILDRILDDLRLSPQVQKEPTEADMLKVLPTFGKPLPIESSEWAQVFVLMPFAESLKPLYTKHILEVTNRLSLSCKRGDDFFSASAIINEIWSAIFHAQVCIADCTGRNPNVFYEIGVAHTIGRPCILISQTIEDIPFDVRHIRSIIYEYTEEGMKQFEQILEKTLRNTLQLRV